MTNLNSRMSCDIGYTPSFLYEQQQHIEPSKQTKQLIEFLKSNPNTDINRKLREEIFFKKIDKGKNDLLKNQTKSSSRQKTDKDNFKETKLMNQQVEKLKFVNKTENRKKAGFFSPKGQSTKHEKCETSPFVLFNKEITEQKAKVPFRLKREIMSLNQDIQFSQKQIPTQKKSTQCPLFLKKSPKTTTSIPQQSFLNNTTIHDFVIMKSLGQGTFGDSFCAIHRPTSSIYTIKRYKKQIIKSHQLQDKFINDIKTQMKLIHPHIVKLYGVFADETFFYMIFQYMESGNLTKTIQQKGGRLTELQVCRKVYEINDALLFLHEKGLIHRDIKPASILTCLNVCKLCDTEWVQQNENLSTHHNTLCKEIDYTAPQALQGKDITAQFDIWGLGLIAFQLLTGQRFIVGSTQKLLIRKIITLKKQLIEVMLPKDCSQGLRQLILSSLQPIPSKRLKSKQINQIKLQKEKELSTNVVMKNLSFSEKIITLSEKVECTDVKGETKCETRGSPKNNGIMFGVKKEIKNEVSTLL